MLMVSDEHPETLERLLPREGDDGAFICSTSQWWMTLTI